MKRAAKYYEAGWNFGGDWGIIRTRNMVEIRAGQLSDAERIVEFELEMAQETEGVQLEREVVSRGVEGVFERPERGTYWVAEEEGKIVGVLLHPLFSASCLALKSGQVFLASASFGLL